MMNLYRYKTIIALMLLLAAAYGFKLPAELGSYLVIEVGETEVLELDADTYNGYEWIVSKIDDPTLIKYEGKEFEYGDKNTDLSVQKMKFKGLKKGRTNMKLDYIKQGEQLPKKSKTIKVSVYN